MLEEGSVSGIQAATHRSVYPDREGKQYRVADEGMMSCTVNRVVAHVCIIGHIRERLPETIKENDELHHDTQGQIGRCTTRA